MPAFTFRNPETDEERALVAVFEVERQMLFALGGAPSPDMMPHNMDYRRYAKIWRREQDRQAVRYAAIAACVAAALPVLDTATS